jgi:diguanylate cyclase (GGDEF)-like protein
MENMKSNESGQEKSLAAEYSQTQLDLISDALDASEDGFAIWKSVRAADGSISDFILLLMNNSGLAGLAGLDHKVANPIGKTLEEVTGEESSKELHDLFVLALLERHGVKGVVRGITSDGSKGYFENTVVPFGRDLVFATYRDVSADEREHKRLVWLTEHDFLTGMPNRAKLQEHLGKSLAKAQVSKTLMAFVFIDIDYFKEVNDTFGHDIGDALLVNFVKRIRHSLPSKALVARIAGDEFGVCIQDIKSEDHLKELMENVFGAMERPFTLGDIETKIACSAGCVVTDGSDQPEEIMRIADKLMYQAKNEGRGRFLIQSVVKTT